MDGFDVLLQTPSVSSVCMMLIQHQKELGRKTVKSITAYPEPVTDAYAPNLLIEIADVE